MKRVYTQFFIVLALLLCAALTLSGVAYAKYQVEAPKTLTATIQNRWTPTVEKEIWTSANETGATLSFSITNDTSSPKTVTIRLLTDSQIGADNPLDLDTTINGAEQHTTMSAHPLADMGTVLQQVHKGKEYIYCADTSTQELTWSINAGATVQGTLTNALWGDEKNLVEHTQLLVTSCGQ